MDIQEKDIVEVYRKMRVASMSTKDSQPSLEPEVIAILTATKILKRVMENCTTKICGAIKQPELKLTLHQADAIIDMNNHGYSEGLGPKNEEACEGWGELLKLAETVTSRTADANLSDAQIVAQEDADEIRKLAYQRSQKELRRGFSGGKL